MCLVWWHSPKLIWLCEIHVKCKESRTLDHRIVIFFILIYRNFTVSMAFATFKGLLLKRKKKLSNIIHKQIGEGNMWQHEKLNMQTSFL